jgi:hypothetical protein
MGAVAVRFLPGLVVAGVALGSATAEKVSGNGYPSVTDWAGPDGRWTVASEGKATRR